MVFACIYAVTKIRNPPPKQGNTDCSTKAVLPMYVPCIGCPVLGWLAQLLGDVLLVLALGHIVICQAKRRQGGVGLEC